MKVALIVPGGVDRSGEVRVIPALLALMSRLSAGHEVHVFATHQEAVPGRWSLEGATVHNLGLPRTPWRAVTMILAEHRRAPFDIVHSIGGACGALAVGVATLLRLPSVVHVRAESSSPSRTSATEVVSRGPAASASTRYFAAPLWSRARAGRSRNSSPSTA